MEGSFASEAGGPVDALCCKLAWRYSAKENS